VCAAGFDRLFGPKAPCKFIFTKALFHLHKRQGHGIDKFPTYLTNVRGSRATLSSPPRQRSLEKCRSGTKCPSGTALSSVVIATASRLGTARTYKITLSSAPSLPWTLASPPQWT